jgi:hypothetical protein
MYQEAFLRQLDIADPSQFRNKPVTVIGAGSIGAVNDNLQMPIEDAVEEIGNQ